MKWQDAKPVPKVYAGGVAGAVGVLVVYVIEWVSHEQVDAQAALILIGAISAVAAWLMPDVPPWKK